ncbi:hypothetical protein GUITHDRAFT_121197 [Guillardia theta CCMP2712]|uniref:Uncharacterized protein n=1 Tax=Guillardia theta (strain CCMP2712) TaxID=905079 RepID=L1I8P7_GUITC|nr:hypothetical protein GUITHDRAFT_121197 [Guillardia theta CCMP2712]EKX32641.1 hypothetical protein GUITHDRAFT_121197 [Guillardia theta CCMP2712]|eukprot:XP_005819621.1 hypothetical protein GUITHDRAFT_121197 [Guillardia theta CCMP2712]
MWWYYGSSRSVQQDLSSTADAWVVLCGQNYQYRKFYLNGLVINDISWQLGSGYVMASDWALSELAIWRGALRAEEIRAVSEHSGLMQKLSAGSSAVYNEPLNVSCDNFDVANNTIAPAAALGRDPATRQWAPQTPPSPSCSSSISALALMRLLLSFVWIQNYLLLTILEDPSSLTASSLKDGALLVSTSLLARIRGGGESESESPTQIKDDDGSGLKRIKMANFQLRKRKKLMIEEEKAVVDMDLRRYQAIKSLFPSFPDRTSRFGELRVPDHVECIKQALLRLKDGQELYVRNGEHTWDGDVNVTGKTIFVRGEQGARLMGQWENRKELRCLEEPNFCIGLSTRWETSMLA